MDTSLIQDSNAKGEPYLRAVIFWFGIDELLRGNFEAHGIVHSVSWILRGSQMLGRAEMVGPAESQREDTDRYRRNVE
jgi:hypothetical protein